MDNKKNINKKQITPSEKKDKKMPLPPEIQSIINDLPDDQQKEFTKFVTSHTFLGMSSISRPHPFFDKLNKSHIDKIIDNSDKSEIREFWGNKLSIIFYISIGVGLFIFLTLYLLDKNPSLYITILQIVLPFLAGMASGFGLSKIKNKN